MEKQALIIEKNVIDFDIILTINRYYAYDIKTES